MKRIDSHLIGASAIICAAFIAPTVGAVEKCSLKTLKGTYIYSSQGQSLGTLYGEAGQESYDGKGNITNTFTASDGASGTTSGTYTIDSNCNGHATYQSGEDYTFYASPKGDVFTYIYNNTGAGNFRFGTETRTSRNLLK